MPGELIYRERVAGTWALVLSEHSVNWIADVVW